jgi:hypothetical protein
MPNHGAEAGLPITPLAQWMRDTTGRPDDGSTGGLVVRKPSQWTYTPDLISWRSASVVDFTVPSPEKPGTLTVDDVLAIAQVDELRLERAANEAIAAYTREGHSYDEIKEHERRIWALHDQLLREAV